MKRYGSRRKSFRRRTFKRRRARGTRRYSSGRYFKLVQKVDLASQSVSNGGTLGLAYTFTMNSLPDAAAMTNIYDEYMITKVKCIIRPTANVAAASSGPQSIAPHTYSGLGLIHSCIDYNDDTVPGSVGAVTSYRNSKTTRSDRIHIRSLAPKPQAVIYRGALANGYMPTRAWIPVAYNDTPHYALKVMFEGGPGDPAYYSYLAAIQLQITVLFRNQR